MYFIQRYLRIILLVSLMSLSPFTHANSVACFNSNIGNYCVELFETQAPRTTTNFLEYIHNGSYTNGIFHRSVPNFIVQAGGFRIANSDQGVSLAAVSKLPPIENEFKISNTRGTLAMAKVAGDPDSATSEWFINLNDNTENLDNQNNGFSVFGRVIFDGMDVIDAIGNLPVTNLGGNLANAPTINYDGVQLLISNLVQINSIEVTEVSGIFSDGFLSFSVDAGSSGLLDVSLQLIEDSPNIIFELDPSSITPIQTLPENGATYSAIEGSLTIPSVMINATTVVTNVLMKLTDANNFQFTLISMEQTN